METRYAQRNCTRPLLMVYLFVLIYVGLFLKVWAVARPASLSWVVFCVVSVFLVFRALERRLLKPPKTTPYHFFLLTWWITFDNNTPGTYSVPLTMYMALLRSVIGGTSITNGSCNTACDVSGALLSMTQHLAGSNKGLYDAIWPSVQGATMLTFVFRPRVVKAASCIQKIDCTSTSRLLLPPILWPNVEQLLKHPKYAHKDGKTEK